MKKYKCSLFQYKAQKRLMNLERLFQNLIKRQETELPEVTVLTERLHSQTPPHRITSTSDASNQAVYKPESLCVAWLGDPKQPTHFPGLSKMPCYSRACGDNYQVGALSNKIQQHHLPLLEIVPPVLLPRTFSPKAPWYQDTVSLDMMWIERMSELSLLEGGIVTWGRETAENNSMDLHQSAWQLAGANWAVLEA